MISVIIQNISDDIRSAIQEEVWRGTANGETIPQIAERIEQTGINHTQQWGHMLTIEDRAN